MDYNLEIQKLLIETDNQANPDDKIVVLKQAINIADANNDIGWGYDLRLFLIQMEQFTPRSSDRFPAFVWILNVLDNDPYFFSDKDIETILNEYQWMAFESYRNADVSREQIMSIFADFEKRLIKYGYSKRSYYSVLICWHLFIGEIDKAKEYTTLRESFPRDCFYYETEIIEWICIELVKGNFDKAISMAREHIVPKPDGYGGNIISIPVLSTLIYYLSKAGDPRGDEYFRQIESEISRYSREYPLSLGTYVFLMHHMAITDPEKAWYYFAKCTEWGLGARDLLSFEFSLNLLPLLKQGGTRVLYLNSGLPYYRSDNTYDVNELYEYYLNRTLSFVRRFDERNGNAHFKEQFDEVFNTL